MFIDPELFRLVSSTWMKLLQEPIKRLTTTSNQPKDGEDKEKKSEVLKHKAKE